MTLTLAPLKAESILQLAVKKKVRGSQHANDLPLHCQLEDGRGHLAKNAQGQEKLGADSQPGNRDLSPTVIRNWILPRRGGKRICFPGACR